MLPYLCIWVNGSSLVDQHFGYVDFILLGSQVEWSQTALQGGGGGEQNPVSVKHDVK